MTKTIIKGFIIGSTMMIPGVSGGSMAMILGLYDKLISSISSFFKDIKANIIFLLVFSMATLVGIVLCASQISKVIELFPSPSMMFFIGLVFGSIPMLYKKAETDKFKPIHLLYVFIGIAVVYSINFLPESNNTIANTSFADILMQTFTGIVISIGFILPGISTSYLLLILGTYDYVMAAISSLNFIALLPLIIGFVLGVILLTKLLEYLLNKHQKYSYLIIIGFLLGSFIHVFPIFIDIIDIIISVITFTIGAFLIYYISKKEEKIENRGVNA